jgi:hypothetical protein
MSRHPLDVVALFETATREGLCRGAALRVIASGGIGAEQVLAIIEAAEEERLHAQDPRRRLGAVEARQLRRARHSRAKAMAGREVSP